jgi:hypothetical protein
MRMVYNPKHLGDFVQIWKCFLLGSLVTASLVYFVVTENAVVFLVTLGMIIAGVALFIKTNMEFIRPTYLFQNLVSLGAGALVSLVINVAGYLAVYLVVIFILVLVTWLHRYTLNKIKAKTEAKTETKEETKSEA